MIRVPCFTDLKICACMHAPGHEAFDKKMSDVFEACWVMGKYLQGVKEAEEEMEQGRGRVGGTKGRITTFLHFSGVVYALSLTG